MTGFQKKIFNLLLIVIASIIVYYSYNVLSEMHYDLSEDKINKESSLKKLDCDNERKYTLVVLKNENTNKFLLKKKYKLTLIDEEEDYLTMDTEKMCDSDHQLLMDEILKEGLADEVYLNGQHYSDDNEDESQKIEKKHNFSSKIMDKLISLQKDFDKATNIEFGSIDGEQIAFLFPSDWIVEQEGELKHVEENGVISFKKINRKNVDPYKLSTEILSNNESIEGSLDSKERLDGSVTFKWLVSDREKIRQKALIMYDEESYLLEANSYTLITDFDIFTSSFYVKKRP